MESVRILSRLRTTARRRRAQPSSGGMVRNGALKYSVTGLLLAMVYGFTVSDQPPCRTAVDQPEFAFAAGCMITQAGRMLAVRHRYNGKLGFPGGRAKSGESAQCVAHRETWEETGENVIVHEMIRRFDNGFALYHCELTNAHVARTAELEVPSTAHGEISQILWIDPSLTEASEWRFPRDHAAVLQLLKQ